MIYIYNSKAPVYVILYSDSNSDQSCGNGVLFVVLRSKNNKIHTSDSVRKGNGTINDA